MLALGHQIADQVALDLVKRITAMGLPAQRASPASSSRPRARSPSPDNLVATSTKANKVKRMAIGFHQGQSSVSAAVQLYHVTGLAQRRGQLLDFTATGTSSRRRRAQLRPWARAAAAQVAAATAAAVAVEVGATLSADAGRLSAAVARNLQTFFAKQSWTDPPSAIPDNPFLKPRIS